MFQHFLYYFKVQMVKSAKKTLVSVKFVYFMPKSCFGPFCIISKSKWLNLLKTFVLVKFVYFYAKIICFGTFCIIPVQMVKSAKKPLFWSNLYIFLPKSYVLALFVLFQSLNG